MCTGNVPCLYGTCTSIVTDKTSNAVCVCHELYAGSQCSFRSGLLYFELPLAIVLLLAFVAMGLRMSEAAWTLLRIPESTQDFFAFPRAFRPIEREHIRLQRFIGTWEGPTHKHFAMRVNGSVTRMVVVLVIMLELLPFMQIAAMAFMPAVPWPPGSKLQAKFLRLLLVHPLWAHQYASKYPELVFYSSIATVPALCMLAYVLGLKRFPLFKPQPLASPTEDLCTLVLRALSSWLVLPLMIALLMPLECLFVGFLRGGSYIRFPVYDPVCFTWLRLGHTALGFATTTAYTLLASGIGIQLNCESSRPQPTMWTDARYMWLVHSLHAPLALSVVAFGNSNPLALCMCCIMAGLYLVCLNLWMRPCIYSLVNGLRLYGAVLATWTGLAGVVASVIDDPWKNSTFDVWSLGSIALTAVTFSALFVHYSEEVWFQLSLLKGTPWTASRGRAMAVVMSAKAVAKDGPDTGVVNEEAPNSTAHIELKSLKPKLPPLHILKKRARRSTNKILAS